MTPKQIDEKEYTINLIESYLKKTVSNSFHDGNFSPDRSFIPSAEGRLMIFENEFEGDEKLETIKMLREKINSTKQIISEIGIFAGDRI